MLTHRASINRGPWCFLHHRGGGGGGDGAMLLVRLRDKDARVKEGDELKAAYEEALKRADVAGLVGAT